MSRIVDAFSAVCARQKNKTAFYYAEKGVRKIKTYENLKKDTEQAVEYLFESGVKSGDRILAFAVPSYRLCVFMMAAFTLGASIMYVDIWAKQERLKSVFSEYRPDYVLVSDKTKPLKLLFREIRKIKKVINVDAAPRGGSEMVRQKEIGEETVALLTMTTGSTGKPKIAVRTHRNLFEQLKLINENLDSVTEDETILTTSYIYVFANVLNGYTNVLPQVNLAMQSKRKLNRKLAKFRDLPVSMIMTSPDFCLKTENFYPQLKRVFFGGAILNLREAETIINKFGSADIIYIYGATECNLIASTRLRAYAETLEKERRCALGAAVFGVQIKIAGNDEIAVSSSALLKDYLVQDTSNKTTEGQTIWHHTGDTGVYENGILYYFGRSKYAIETGCGRFYSNQIEQSAVLQFKEILKCAALQKEDTVYMFIESTGKIDFSKVEDFLKENFKIKKLKLLKIKKIPCDVKHHTKIDYKKLRKRIR